MPKSKQDASPKRRREGNVTVIITRSYDPARAQRLYDLIDRIATKGATAQKDAA